MKRVIFVLAILCLLGGCTSPQPTLKVGVESSEGAPLKVGIKAEEELPVKIGIEEDKALPVKLDIQDGRELPVDVKITRRTVVVAMIPVAVALIAALGACFGAVGAWRAARNTKLVAEGQLFYTLLREYASTEMRDDLRMLYKWDREKVGKDKSRRDEEAQKWITALSNDENKDRQKDADTLDAARRHVTHYFLNILELKKSNYAHRRFVKGMCKAVGTKVLDVNFPLEKALIEHLGQQDKMPPAEVDETIKKLRKKFEELKKLSKNAQVRV